MRIVIEGANSRSLEHFSLVIGSILVLDLLSHRLDLIDSVRDTDEVSPSDTVERVACGADLTVDYKCISAFSPFPLPSFLGSGSYALDDIFRLLDATLKRIISRTLVTTSDTGMVEGIKPSFLLERVVGRVKTDFSGSVGACLGKER